jgi:hypothetical protein
MSFTSTPPPSLAYPLAIKTNIPYPKCRKMQLTKKENIEFNATKVWGKETSF